MNITICPDIVWSAVDTFIQYWFTVSVCPLNDHVAPSTGFPKLEYANIARTRTLSSLYRDNSESESVAVPDTDLLVPGTVLNEVEQLTSIITILFVFNVVKQTDLLRIVIY